MCSGLTIYTPHSPTTLISNKKCVSIWWPSDECDFPCQWRWWGYCMWKRNISDIISGIINSYFSTVKGCQYLIGIEFGKSYFIWPTATSENLAFMAAFTPNSSGLVGTWNPYPLKTFSGPSLSYPHSHFSISLNSRFIVYGRGICTVFSNFWTA